MALVAVCQADVVPPQAVHGNTHHRRVAFESHGRDGGWGPGVRQPYLLNHGASAANKWFATVKQVRLSDASGPPSPHVPCFYSRNLNATRLCCACAVEPCVMCRRVSCGGRLAPPRDSPTPDKARSLGTKLTRLESVIVPPFAHPKDDGGSRCSAQNAMQVKSAL